MKHKLLSVMLSLALVGCEAEVKIESKATPTKSTPAQAPEPPVITVEYILAEHGKTNNYHLLTDGVTWRYQCGSIFGPEVSTAAEAWMGAIEAAAQSLEILRTWPESEAKTKRWEAIARAKN